LAEGESEGECYEYIETWVFLQYNGNNIYTYVISKYIAMKIVKKNFWEMQEIVLKRIKKEK
jgi:hypothetical protein